MQSTSFLPQFHSKMFAVLFLVLMNGQVSQLAAQEQPPAAKPLGESVRIAPIEILDEPKTIDPASLLPPQLATKVTVKFDGQPLKDVFTWLQREQQMNVVVDYKALTSVKLLDTDPITEELNEAPLYLLLDRLDTLGIGWYMQDNSLRITSREGFLLHETTVSYNLGDLFDAGYVPQDLIRTISRCCGCLWDLSEGALDSGAALLLGDVLFVRQTETAHREVAGLLAAIRNHGRRTLTLDSPEHAILRAALLEKSVTVDFLETPLVVAVQDLSRQSQISIRLDRKSVRERTPVSLKATDQKLGAVLKSLFANSNLTWYLRDEVLWIATAEAASQIQKSAVFDVRDLCRDRDESQALKVAIKKQSRAQWKTESERGGSVEIPKPGVLVVRHTEGTLDEILLLLENYRTALRMSKLRSTPEPDPKEVITGYYRLPKPMADDMRKTLPKLILPNTWQSPGFPDAVGEITEISIDAKGGVMPNKSDANALVSENVVLVIRQSRAAHQSIGKLIQTLLNSKSIDLEAALEISKKPQGQSPSFGRGLIPGP